MRELDTVISTMPYDEILHFWFGRVEQTIVPTEYRARIWFGEDKEIDDEIAARFGVELDQLVAGHLSAWEETPRGQLASIIMLDQFSRHVNRGKPEIFERDEKALHICLKGLREEVDHSLSLIERVFYYFPLLHSEKIGYQEQSVRVYGRLVDLAFSETRVIFDSFFKFANHHYSIIKQFGRFPQRNVILGRESTAEELAFLREIEEEDG